MVRTGAHRAMYYRNIVVIHRIILVPPELIMISIMIRQVGFRKLMRVSLGVSI